MGDMFTSQKTSASTQQRQVAQQGSGGVAVTGDTRGQVAAGKGSFATGNVNLQRGSSLTQTSTVTETGLTGEDVVNLLGGVNAIVQSVTSGMETLEAQQNVSGPSQTATPLGGGPNVPMQYVGSGGGAAPDGSAGLASPIIVDSGGGGSSNILMFVLIGGALVVVFFLFKRK